MEPRGGPPFLIVAHPGHELRLFHWMERTRPDVFVLTDGSGGEGVSRLGFSRDCLARTQARPGAVFGPFPDRHWYAAIQRADAAPFVEATRIIAGAAAACRPAIVVADPVEGYNPMHDLCAAVADAVTQALIRDGGDPQRLTFPLTESAPRGLETRIDLDGDAVGRKRDALLAYQPLLGEISALMAADASALGTEALAPAQSHWPEHWSPHYEEVGRQRVASGRYEAVITYDHHVGPIARAILQARF